MRSRRSWRHSRTALCIALLVTSASACAAIWGFEDGQPLQDGSDGSADATTPADGGAGDAAPDVTIAVDATADDAASAADEAASDGLYADEAPATADGSPCPGVCAPAPPTSDWQGPYAMFEVTDGGAPPDCNFAGWTQAYDLGLGADAAPATCDCKCGPPSNFSCGAPTLATFIDRTCQTSCATAPKATIGACTPIPPAPPPCGATARIAFSAPVPEGGSCVATTGFDASPVGWSARARLCGGTGAGVCGNGSAAPATCMPPSPGGEFYCIARAGSYACPTPYNVPHGWVDGGTAYYADAGDTRGCSCSCGAPGGPLCAGGVVLFDSGTCNDAGSFVDSGTCITPGPALASAVSVPTDAGSCTPYGVPTGGLSLTSSVTVCCTR